LDTPCPYREEPGHKTLVSIDSLTPHLGFPLPQVYLEFMNKKLVLPPPFNLVPTPETVVNGFQVISTIRRTMLKNNIMN
jgi:hypothetical protein